MTPKHDLNVVLSCRSYLFLITKPSLINIKITEKRIKEKKLSLIVLKFQTYSLMS